MADQMYNYFGKKVFTSEPYFPSYIRMKYQRYRQKYTLFSFSGACLFRYAISVLHEKPLYGIYAGGIAVQKRQVCPLAECFCSPVKVMREFPGKKYSQVKKPGVICRERMFKTAF